MFQAPPRLLMGVAFLFWGGMQDQALAGLIAAILFEGRHWISLRWSFGEKGFARAWQLCILLLIAAVVALFQMEDPDPSDFLAVLAWMPFIMMPIGLAQQYASDRGVPMTTFSFIARRKIALDRKLGRPVRMRPFQLGYPYLTLVLICSGIAVSDLLVYSVGVLVLLGAALFHMSGGRHRPWAWSFAYLMAGTVALGTGYGVIHAYDYVVRLTSPGRITEGPELSMETRTNIGQVTNLQQDQSIRWRYYAPPETRPERVRLASYNRPLGNHWRATLRPRDLEEQIDEEREVGGDFERLLESGKDRYDFDRTLERDGNFGQVGRLEGLVISQGLIPMPLGTGRMENVHAENLAANSMGSVQINQPDHGAASLIFRSKGDGTPGDLDPFTRDLDLSEEEFDGLDLFLRNLGHQPRPPAPAGKPSQVPRLEAEALVQRMQMEFATQFTYSTFSDYSRSHRPMTDFLNDQRVGHCEYFASASTMLLRRAGIPARYCVGYVVREAGDDENEWVLRGKHAHAWCQIYVGGTWVKEQHGKGEEHWRCRGGEWVEVDLTPARWLNETRGGWWQALSDWFQGFRTAFILWLSGPVVSVVINWLIVVLGVGLVGYLFVKLTITGRRTPGQKDLSWDERIHSGNQLAGFEKWLAKRVGKRPASLPMSTWLLENLPDGEQEFVSDYESLAFSGGTDGEWKALKDRAARVRRRMAT
ncbi:MAG: transglutaminase-like domain-containing protein [Akkermansiaceae bacterium]